MKAKLTETIELPEGVSCAYEDSILICKKDSMEVKRKVNLPGFSVKTDSNKLVLESSKGNKVDYKTMKTTVAHLKNIFSGFREEYICELESCNVHFPMTLKVEKNELVINNFLGEKTPRRAKILPNVKVDVKGQKITLKSFNREAVGQTAANFEKATKVANRDRRVFQDGIYITKKATREI